MVVSCEPNQRTLVRPVVVNGATMSQIECVAADPQAAAYAQATSRRSRCRRRIATRAQPVYRDWRRRRSSRSSAPSAARPVRTRQVVYDEPVRKKRSVKKSVVIIGDPPLSAPEWAPGRQEGRADRRRDRRRRRGDLGSDHAALAQFEGDEINR